MRIRSSYLQFLLEYTNFNKAKQESGVLVCVGDTLIEPPWLILNVLFIFSVRYKNLLFVIVYLNISVVLDSIKIVSLFA